MTQLDLRDSSHPKDPITSHSRWPAVPAMEAANKRKAETTGAETHSKAAKPAEASAKTDEEFRNYDTSDRQSTVEQHYRLMRQNQTYDFAKRMQKKYNSFDHAEMEIYQAFESLGTRYNPFLDIVAYILHCGAGAASVAFRQVNDLTRFVAGSTSGGMRKNRGENTRMQAQVRAREAVK